MRLPEDEASPRATAGISQSSGVSAGTEGPGPRVHARPPEGCPFSTCVHARVVREYVTHLLPGLG